MKEQYEFKIKKLSDLSGYDSNSRTHSEEQIQQIAKSIKTFGFTNPILIDENNGIIAGHGRALAASILNIDNVPCMVIDGLTQHDKAALVIADNKLAENAGWNYDALKSELGFLNDVDFDLSLTGFSDGELLDLLKIEIDPYADGVLGSMVDNFGQPPFSVLDTRKGDWLERKRQWKKLIADNAESRTNAKAYTFGEQTGVSLLDPVMSEIIVNWFGAKNMSVLDPFAGDTVFGFVAGSSGMKFTGIELRKEQADLNQQRCNDAKLDCKYINDSSENMFNHVDKESFDLIFTCPPYADLEVYSDNPKDLSNMSHSDFFIIYKDILTKTFLALKQNRFAVVVMGEVRDKKGMYIGTIPKTIDIMEQAGYVYYNEIILINSIGTLPLRAGKSMRATRKIGKMHQNILVFVKGDPKKASKELGDIKIKMEFKDEQ